MCLLAKQLRLVMFKEKLLLLVEFIQLKQVKKYHLINKVRDKVRVMTFNLS